MTKWIEQAAHEIVSKYSGTTHGILPEDVTELAQLILSAIPTDADEIAREAAEEAWTLNEKRYVAKSEWESMFSRALALSNAAKDARIAELEESLHEANQMLNALNIENEGFRLALKERP